MEGGSTYSSAQCPGCRERDARIERLERELAELRRRLAEIERSSKRQAAPFRRREHVPQPKKPGRPTGHPATLRPPPERIDRVIDVPLERCPDCDVPLENKTVHPQYQTDLPPLTPIVTQFNLHAGTCPCCGKYRQGRHPEQTSDAIGAAANQLGPVVLTMAAEMKHRLGVPYRKICDFFETYIDLSICPGALCRADQRLAQLARPTYELLIDALRQSNVVHADETGWRISRVNAWLWVFSSQTVTIYAIRTSRGHEVPEEILGKSFQGVLIVDGLASYDVLDCIKGRCVGHILRRSRELAEQATPTGRLYLNQLVELFQEAIELATRRDTMTAAGYERRVSQIENRFDAWLDNHGSRPSPELERLAKHLGDHRWQWLLFLYDPEVPPTNNHAERMLRPAVISRKIGGCNKTLRGALVHSVLSSLMVTCKQQGHKFLDLAQRLFHGEAPQTIELATLPSG
jgi:transposase